MVASELVVMFAAALSSQNILIVDKADSVMMHRAASLLDAAGVIQDDNFMHNYASTIGEVIFVPFQPGIERGVWDLDNQLAVLAHEARHVEQWRSRGGMAMTATYATSSGRVMIEGDAYTIQMLVSILLCMDIWDLDHASRLMRNYAVRPSDELSFEALLLSRLGSFRNEAYRERFIRSSPSLTALFNIVQPNQSCGN